MYFVVVQSLSCVQLFAIPWPAAHQASLSFSISWSLLKLMSVESVMPSNHLILCHILFLLPSIVPRVRVFSSESGVYIRWTKYGSFNLSISPSSEYSSPLGLTGLISLLSKRFPRGFCSTAIKKKTKQFFSIQPSLWSNSHICT